MSVKEMSEEITNNVQKSDSYENRAVPAVTAMSLMVAAVGRMLWVELFVMVWYIIIITLWINLSGSINQ